MPSNNGSSKPNQNASQGHRQTTSRIVPAIPLPLIRAKATKSQAPPTANTGDDVPSGGSSNVKEAPDGGDGDSRPSTAPNHQPAGLAQAPVNQQELRVTGDQSSKPSAEATLGLESIHTSELNQAYHDAQSLPVGQTSTVPHTLEATRSSPTVTADPGSLRKPMEHFDMRQIRTELPPAFIPSAELHTPQSAASSTQNRQHSVFPHAHPTNLSAGSIVFGGHDSSASSPAPPHSAGSGFGPPKFVSQLKPDGHTHRDSDAYRRYGAPPPPALPWSARPGYTPTAPPQFYNFPPGQMPTPLPPHENFGPNNTRPIPGHNRSSRAASQSSSAVPDNHNPTIDLQSPIGLELAPDSAGSGSFEHRSGLPVSTRFRPPPFPPHVNPYPPPSQFQHPELTPNFESAETLRSHIIHQLGHPELADCRLDIVEDLDGPSHSIDCHQLILARSPTLLQLIRESNATALPLGKAPVRIRLRGPYVRLGPFMDALRYLYGGAPPSLTSFGVKGAGPDHGPSNEERMEATLQQLATSAWLKIPSIAQRGVDTAAGLLHWDTLGAALSFALDGGLSSAWSVDDGSEERISTCSSDDSHGRLESGGAPTHDPYATYLLYRVLDFVVHMLPPNFYLDASAPELPSVSRLPQALSTQQNRLSRSSDPRLSRIRFGEVPLEDHQRPSFVATTISSVLLSVPFPLLKFSLEHFDLSHRLGPETVSSIMRQVVGERELRRQRALQLRSGQPHHSDDATDARVQNLYWEEMVEHWNQHRVGFRLARRRRGIDTPPSSGTESEQRK